MSIYGDQFYYSKGQLPNLCVWLPLKLEPLRSGSIIASLSFVGLHAHIRSGEYKCTENNRKKSWVGTSFWGEMTVTYHGQVICRRQWLVEL